MLRTLLLLKPVNNLQYLQRVIHTYISAVGNSVVQPPFLHLEVCLTHFISFPPPPPPLACRDYSFLTSKQKVRSAALLLFAYVCQLTARTVPRNTTARSKIPFQRNSTSYQRPPAGQIVCHFHSRIITLYYLLKIGLMDRHTQ